MDSCLRRSKIFLMGGLLACLSLVVSAPSVLGETAEEGAIESAETEEQRPDNSRGYDIIHVSATSGSDVQGDGTQLRPLQTITYALAQAEGSTLILLAGGVYSAGSGEVFPITLKSGVTVQGMIGFDIGDVIIQGGGSYYSSVGGLRNVAILGADNAGLANVTVSNAAPEGTGLWIESGDPVILNNAFLQNGANGVYIAGSGAPVIRGNYFSENGSAGLVIAGPSSAAVESNIFENTGTGITVAPGATPTISNNQISSNLDGLVVHAEARPTLQDNQISRNRRNSILDYSTWTDTPTASVVGAAQPPPPSRTAAATSPSSDNSAAVAEVPEAVQTDNAETGIAIATNPPPEVISEPPAREPAADLASVDIAAMPELSETDPSDQETLIAQEPSTQEEVENNDAMTLPALAAAENSPVVAENPPVAVQTFLSDNLSNEMAQTNEALTSIDVAWVPATVATASFAGLDLSPIATASEEMAARFTDKEPIAENEPRRDHDETAEAATPETDLVAPLPSVEQTPNLASSELSSNLAPIDIPIIPPPIETIATPDAVPPTVATGSIPEDTVPATSDLPELPASPSNAASGDSTRLTVPNSEIPMGSGGNVPELFTVGAGATIPVESPPPPPSLASSLGLNYRVLIASTEQVTEDQVQAIVPDAFSVQVDGQTYIQAGAYPTLAEAESNARRLNQAGLPAQVKMIP
ncbi:DUF1565 domain-containing protein [Oscillatoria sp. CS-180]|uniref:DUF1565 domain-containing protein n=1 Tax=Oscillatoria sp. CS-180 TaxID=3021720 RepID=UPI00232E8E2E|nr:DUF1565 domain-containing protein [Oscillatoria sp. CS-180]MDB9524857.1 DUF1565 domain-containing protein [Oscillatoria sp. CS-180]